MLKVGALVMMVGAGAAPTPIFEHANMQICKPLPSVDAASGPIARGRNGPADDAMKQACLRRQAYEVARSDNDPQRVAEIAYTGCSELFADDLQVAEGLDALRHAADQASDAEGALRVTILRQAAVYATEAIVGHCWAQ